MLKTLILCALAALAAVTVTVLAGQPTTVPGTPSPAYAACTEEDGSGPQAFPCFWAGGSNGQGRTYVLTAAPGSL